MKVVIGVTGASGAIYAYTLVRMLHQLQIQTAVILTDMGVKVMAYECGVTVDQIKQYTSVYDDHDLFAPVASGSYHADAMVVIPCSMNTLGSIANGLGDTLLTRAASVTLKEQRKLVLVTRETPLSPISIENMLKLANIGVCIMPASPGFYHKPTELWQLVEGICARVLDQLGIASEFGKPWTGGDADV